MGSVTGEDSTCPQFNAIGTLVLLSDQRTSIDCTYSVGKDGVFRWYDEAALKALFDLIHVDSFTSFRKKKLNRRR